MSQGNSQRSPSEKKVAPCAYSVKDAAEAYAISRSTLYVLLKDGKIRDRKVGGRRVILKSDLDALVGLEG
ncbi:helix-turn-helix domain-containing protein [Xanthobacter sp. 91]|uniref:helix-turn-helix domain-containing protein n=1 Tax=Xanthobacter sp. 91 TaxID=1117244 RepID=UPI0009DD79FE|nr:helix-turn-helix domain-containing protein [Xanthobacter sp. 91]